MGWMPFLLGDVVSSARMVSRHRKSEREKGVVEEERRALLSRCEEYERIVFSLEDKLARESDSLDRERGERRERENALSQCELRLERVENELRCSETEREELQRVVESNEGKVERAKVDLQTQIEVVKSLFEKRILELEDVFNVNE